MAINSQTDDAVIDLLSRARNQLSFMGNMSPDDDPLIVMHERGVSVALADDINEFIMSVERTR